MIIEKIYQYLSEEGKTLDEAIAYEVGLMAQWAFKRQFMTDEEAISKGRVRLSAAGRCPRQNAYAFHGFEKKGKEVDARSKFTFFAGDLTELAIVGVAKAALKKYGGGSLVATGRDQVTISLPVNGALIQGHPDGLYLALKTIYLLEVKSCHRIIRSGQVMVGEDNHRNLIFFCQVKRLDGSVKGLLGCSWRQYGSRKLTVPGMKSEL